ncbi:type I restriction-modification system subunit M, partial [Erysipelothrix rhusiopathiae]|nr:type I restriction-modification system subunit M [Erysipelothrix rhusiopathiae]
ENDFNLNIPRYVDTFEEEEPVDLFKVGEEMKKLKKEKQELKHELLKMMEQLKYSEEDAAWMQGAFEVIDDEK